MKKSFLPEISVTEIFAKISMQNLLNARSQSILKLITVEDNANLKLICKWGFDGSSGHCNYKQKFTQNSSETDEFCF